MKCRDRGESVLKEWLTVQRLRITVRHAMMKEKPGMWIAEVVICATK
jgi:hypothetical protein